MQRAGPLTLAALACTAAARFVLADPDPSLAPSSLDSSSPPAEWQRWLNPIDWPFIPVPLITTDPNSGITVGLLPTWLETDPQHHIDEIVAPDIQFNPNFGWGGHARILEFPSADVQWSATAGLNQHVQRTIDLEYLRGRSRERRWTIGASLLWQRDGTPRFYGIGNDTGESAATNYTGNTQLAEVQAGYNFNHTWQVQYTFRFQDVDVSAGTLPGIPSIQDLFGYGLLVTTREILDRLSLVYDTRDDISVPSEGMRWVAYSGFAQHTAFGQSAYSEAGVDGSMYWPVAPATIIATHLALRYLPGEQSAAFWELSTLGGGASVIGGEQPLRGFGAGRFTGRNALSFTSEVRQRVAAFAMFNTDIELEVAPFVDLGKVFEDPTTSPVSQLHKVVGVGFRGIARPFVVGHVDVGYGSEGAAVFTGIAYPF